MLLLPLKLTFNPFPLPCAFYSGGIDFTLTLHHAFFCRWNWLHPYPHHAFFLPLELTSSLPSTTFFSAVGIDFTHTLDHAFFLLLELTLPLPSTTLFLQLEFSFNPYPVPGFLCRWNWFHPYHQPSFFCCWNWPSPLPHTTLFLPLELTLTLLIANLSYKTITVTQREKRLREMEGRLSL